MLIFLPKSDRRTLLSRFTPAPTSHNNPHRSPFVPPRAVDRLPCLADVVLPEVDLHPLKHPGGRGS